MFTFNKNYFITAVMLFLVEVGIALYVRDSIIRPYGGDFLVVIFLYCLLRSFLNITVVRAAVAVLCFAYAVEWMQYLQLSKELGLDRNPVAAAVLGNYFEWLDMLLYTLGILTVLLFELVLSKKERQTFDRKA